MTSASNGGRRAITYRDFVGGEQKKNESLSLNCYALESKSMARLLVRLKRSLKMRIKAVLRSFVMLDYYLRRVRRSPVMIPLRRKPERILLVNLAHIGDVVISTSVIPILRAGFPSAEFGFLVGPWAKMVISGHPEIRHVHSIARNKFNRGTAGARKKRAQYRSSRAAVLSELSAVGYDVAICLYTYHPDMLDLVWEAGIPRRIGFRTSVHAVYATDLVDLPSGPFVHESVRQCAALKPLGIDPKHFDLRKSTLPPSSESDVAEVQTILGQSDGTLKPYRIIHIGAGAEVKEMPLQFWRDVAKELSERHVLLFTGQGSREATNIERLISGLPNCVNACARLSWRGFVAAIRNAELLYGVDSAAGHVAAAVGTRCITMLSARDEFGRWRPDGPLSIVFSHPLPCSPCYRANGCSEMSCLHAASPTDLVSLL